MTTTVGSAALAALLFGLASAVQHRVARGVDRHAVLHPGLILALLRRPVWVLALLASLAGLGLQVFALTRGSIIVVQTVLVSSLLWTAVGETLLARRRPGRRLLVGATMTAGGLVGFLLLLRPTEVAEPGRPSTSAVVVLVAGCIAAAGAAAWYAARGSGAARTLGLAVATGTGYGLTAALLKLAGGELRQAWTAPLGHPALYGACLVGLAAFLLGQNTLHQGHQATVAVAVILVVDPLVGVAAGVLWFGEQPATSALAVCGALVLLGVAVTGVVLGHTSGRGTTRPRAVPVRR